MGILHRMQRTAIDRTDARVNQLGASLFFDPVTAEAARHRGVTDVVALICGGRAGAMGNVDVTRMVGAFPFISPTMLEACWPAVEAAGGPVAMHRVLSEAQSETARAHWDATALGVIGATARDLVASVDDVAPGLFTGWRTVALDAAQNRTVRDIAGLFALRELRGDIHIESVRETGLTPLEAEIATRGPVVAELHGWPQPYPEAAPFEQRSRAAGERTSERMFEIYCAVLDDLTFEAFNDALDTVVGERR
jgi:hypothetical protein